MNISEFKSFSNKTEDGNAGAKVLSRQRQPFVFEGIDLELPELVFFKDIKEFTLPFNLNTVELHAWLKLLNHGEASYFSCQQVYKVIKKLNGSQCDPELRLTLLNDIELATLPLVKPLEQAVLDAKIPLTTTEQSYQELIAAIYVLLAHGYAHVARDACSLPQEEQPVQVLTGALYSGLQALHRLLLHTCEAYAQPYKGFWSSCHRFYHCAELSRLHECKIRHDGREVSPHLSNTIDGIFKNLLLFYLSGPHQCKPKNMKTLFNALANCVSNAKVHKKIDIQDAARFFSISLDEDLPPVCPARCAAHDDGMRYLETVQVAKMAYDTLHNEVALLPGLNHLKRSTLVQIVKNLGMGSHRKFDRAATQKKYTGIIGYENILRHLRNPCAVAEGSAVKAIDAKMQDSLKLADLELVPMIEEERYGNVSTGWQKIVDDRKDNDLSMPIWRQEDDCQDKDLTKFEIVDSNVKGYGILFKEHGGKIVVGEYIGIFIGGEVAASKCEVGIIRRIRAAERGVFSLGVELVASAAEPVRVYRADNVWVKSWALLLRGIKAVRQPDGIIYNSHQFNIGDTICLEQGNKIGMCTINKLLHATPDLVHAELLVQK